MFNPISLVRDHRTKEALTAHGVAVRSFNADLLYELWEINDDEGHPFKTFTEFWDRCLGMPYDPNCRCIGHTTEDERQQQRIRAKFVSSFRRYFSVIPSHYAELKKKKCEAHMVSRHEVPGGPKHLHN
ncbi:DNA photolyase [Lithospermum erythrorhizon]|uniref:DNA photolyase n=1 Tax=Lithospermum erythrorhizon TaxID=34254 RepID=A0AAV3S255_LITER